MYEVRVRDEKGRTEIWPFSDLKRASGFINKRQAVKEDCSLFWRTDRRAWHLQDFISWDD